MNRATKSTANGITANIDFIPHVAKGATINLTGAITRTVLLYVYTLMLARLLSANELGEYFMMLTIINILGMASTVGVDVGVVRYTALFAGENKYGLVRRSLRVGLAIGIPASIVSAIALIGIAPFLGVKLFDGNEDIVTSLRIFALAVPFWVIARLLNATTQGLHRMKYQVYSRDFGEQISKLMFSAMAIIFGFGVLGVTFANVSSMLIAALMSMVFVIMVLPAPLSVKTPAEPLTKRIIRYSLPLAFSNIFGMFLLWTDTLLLGYFRTTTEVGYYVAALKVVVVTSTIITAFGTVFSPVIADLYNRHEEAHLNELFKTVSRWMYVCSYPIFLLFLLFSEQIMRVFGSEYTVSNRVLVILAVGQLINATVGSAGFVVMMSGKSHLELLNISLSLIVNIALCFLLIPSYGAIGAAIANMTSLVIVNIMRASELWIIIRIHAYDFRYIKPFIAGAAGAIITILAGSYVLTEKGLLEEAVLVAVLLVTYIAAMLAMGLDEQDKKVLKLIKNRLRRGIATA